MVDLYLDEDAYSYCVKFYTTVRAAVTGGGCGGGGVRFVVCVAFGL